MRYAFMLLSALIVSCASEHANHHDKYVPVPVKVVFTDGTADTLTVSSAHRIDANGTLVHYPTQFGSERRVATGVKYVKVIEQ